MIRPREFEVDNGEGIKPDIRIDPETLMNDELFFEVDQDSETITVTLDCLRGLVAAAEELAKTRKPLTTKDCCCGKPEAIGVVHRTNGPCYMDEKAPLTAPQVHELDWPEGVAFEDVLAFARAVERAHGIGGQDD